MPTYVGRHMFVVFCALYCSLVLLLMLQLSYHPCCRYYSVATWSMSVLTCVKRHVSGCWLSSVNARIITTFRGTSWTYRTLSSHCSVNLMVCTNRNPVAVLCIGWDVVSIRPTGNAGATLWIYCHCYDSGNASVVWQVLFICIAALFQVHSWQQRVPLTPGLAVLMNPGTFLTCSNCRKMCKLKFLMFCCRAEALWS